MKVGRSGGKWEENKGVAIWIGGYKNWSIRWALKSILRDLDTNKYKTGGQYLMEQYKREGTRRCPIIIDVLLDKIGYSKADFIFIVGHISTPLFLKH